MSKLYPQMHPLLNANVIGKLFNKNIFTVLNFIETEAARIATITTLQYKDVLNIKKHLINKHSAKTNDGLGYYNGLVAKSALFPTGIKSLDAILQGGLLTGNIYEICGQPASGKTQFNLTLVKNVAESSNLNVFYVDTKRDFSCKKLKSILEANEKASIMSKVLIKQINTAFELINALYEVKKLLQTKQIKLRLLIIDSLPPLFYSINDFSKSYGLLNAMANILQILAKEFYIAVVVTNVVTTWYENVSTENQIIERIGLGKYWLNVPNTRLLIKKSEDSSDSLITILKSNRLLEKLECVVKITSQGII